MFCVFMCDIIKMRRIVRALRLVTGRPFLCGTGYGLYPFTVPYMYQEGSWWPCLNAGLRIADILGAPVWCLVDSSTVTNTKPSMHASVLAQASVGTIAGGRRHAYGSCIHTRCVRSARSRAGTHRLRWWTTSYHTVVIRSSSGMRATGKHYVSLVMIIKL